MIGCLGAGSLYGWSGFSPAVLTHFTAGHTAVSMVFSFALVSFTAGVLLGPAMIARLPGRFRLPSIAFAAAFCLLLASVATGFDGFLVSYGVGFGSASGVLYNHAISEASRSNHPTLLVPASVAAFGLGGAVFGPWAATLVQNGWGLWSTFPTLICLSATAVVSLVIPPDSDKAALSEGGPIIAKPDRTTVRLWIIFASGSVTGLVVLGFAAQISTQATDSPALTAFAVFLIATGNTLGRLAAAAVAKRFGPSHAIAGALLLSLGSLPFLIFAMSAPVLLSLLFLVAVAYGHIAASVPLLVRSLFPNGLFPSAFGLVFTGWGIAGLLGPWSAGVLLEATGNFTTIFIACGMLTLLSLYYVSYYFKNDHLIRSSRP